MFHACFRSSLSSHVQVPVSTVPEDNKLRFGNRVLLFHVQSHAYVSSNLDVRHEGLKVMYDVTTAPVESPCARSVYVLEKFSLSNCFSLPLDLTSNCVAELNQPTIPCNKRSMPLVRVTCCTTGNRFACAPAKSCHQSRCIYAVNRKE